MSKKYLFITAIVSLLLIVLLLPACSESTPEPAAPATPAPAPSTPSTPAEPEKTGTLKLSYTVPKGKTYGMGLDAFAKDFEAATNGRYKVEVYPSNSLVTLPEAWDATVGRKAEIVVTSIGMFLTRFPLSSITGVPTYGWNPKSPADIEKGWQSNWDLINAFPEVKKEYEGVKLLNPMMMDPYFFITKNKQVKTPDDLRGMKVGTAGFDSEIYKAFGGASVHQVPPQAYMNMDKGVTDACTFTFGMINDYSMFEIATYMLLQPITQVQLLLVMNQEAWDELSAADQKTLEDVMAKSLKISAQGSWDSQDLGRNAWNKAGRTIYSPTAEESAAWVDAADISLKKWRDDAMAAGHSEALCNQVLNKWKEIRASYGQ